MAPKKRIVAPSGVGIGAEVSWLVKRGRIGHELHGTVVRVVEAGTMPSIARGMARNHDSYLVVVRDGNSKKYYWPRVSGLRVEKAAPLAAPLPPAVVKASTDPRLAHGDVCSYCGNYSALAVCPTCWPDEPELYLIEDTRQRVGNCVLWWAKDAKGYTCNLDEAHRYTEAEVRERRWRSTDIPRPLSGIKIVKHVRSEHLPPEPAWVRHEGDSRHGEASP